VTQKKISYKLTIIIPFYNALAYKDIVIENIKRNNYDFVCFLLIDDGSEDSYLDFLKKEIKNSNVTYIKNEHNYGISKTRNLGIQECKTEFLLFCDSDDELDLGRIKDISSVFDKKLELQIYNYEHTDKKGVTRKSELYGYEGYLTSKKKIQLVTDYLKNPTGRSILVSCWGRIYNTKFLKQNNIIFNESLCIYEDSLFVAEVFTKARKISISRSMIYKHWLHDNGASYFGISIGKFCNHIEVLTNFLIDNKIKNTKKIKDSAISYYLARTVILICNRSFIYIYKNLKILLNEKSILDSLKSHKIQCIKFPFIKNWMFKNKILLSLLIFLNDNVK